MNEIQSCFERYEKKYLLTREQYLAVKSGMAAYMKPDGHPRYTICNVYYDTENYDLIRASLEKPVYKEKLRVRSYGVPGAEDEVFIELKKKFKGMVYKRRLAMSAQDAAAYLAGEAPPPERSQMTREIDWFLHENAVRPRAYIACDRTAWVAKDDPELRITFDRRIRWRGERLHLGEGDEGEELLAPGEVLMEIKTPTAAPLWLAHALSELEIFPCSFSKYGSCYKEHILHEFIFGGSIHA